MYGPMRFSRTDLVAVTIQRGRDFGLRSYTEIREALDLPHLTTFGDINPELNKTSPQVKHRVPSITCASKRTDELKSFVFLLNSFYRILQNCMTETSRNWNCSLVDCWSHRMVQGQFSPPSFWISLNAFETETASGLRTNKTGKLKSKVQNNNS